MDADNFFEKVYLVVEQIPFGKVTTYGAVAKYISSPKAARMVGWALNASFKNKGFTIPAHRVVNRLGILSGKKYFGNENIMQELLENEGVNVKKDKIIDFNKYFWDPNIELI